MLYLCTELLGSIDEAKFMPKYIVMHKFVCGKDSHYCDQTCTLGLERYYEFVNEFSSPQGEYSWFFKFDV